MHPKKRHMYHTPFGSMIENRSFSAGSGYRYGFNGQEKDDEVAGNGNSYTAEYWQYDSRLGRRWNVDPVLKKYESPYACLGNNPIWFVDINGADTSHSSTNMANRVNNVMSSTIEVNKRGLSLLAALIFGGKTTKIVGNPNFQPNIAAIVQDAANKPSICLRFTEDLDETRGRVPEGAAGAMIKQGENVYLIYINLDVDLVPIGTDFMYEEIFHYANAYSGVAPYSERDGMWGIFNKRSLLEEEARAKHQVISQVRNIKETYFAHHRYEDRKNYGAYIHTSYGAMLRMTDADIINFISTGRGTDHEYNEYEYWYVDPRSSHRSERYTGGSKYFKKSQQGSYDFLLR